MSNKSRIIAGVLLIAALLVASFFFITPNADSLQLASVKEITLSPTDVAIPQVELNRVSKATGYVFRQDGEQYHLYFRNNGTLEKVVGKMPIFTDNPELSDRGFADVVAANGITTYFAYVKYKALPIDGFKLVASELYALKGNRVQKVLSNIQPAGINSIDKSIPLGGAYLDQRANLYVLTLDAMLCVIRDGQIIAKADVIKIGAKYPALPSMFSDPDNTYFLVGTRRFYGPVNESWIKGKYKINL